MKLNESEDVDIDSWLVAKTKTKQKINRMRVSETGQNLRF